MCGFNRIMLDYVQINLAGRITVGEARILDGLQRVKPVNLDLEDVPLTAQIGLSDHLGYIALPAFGEANNAEPRPPSNENSEISGDVQRPNSPTKFLGQKEAERVEEWREKIDPDAAPTLPPDEPKAEEEQKTGRRVLKEVASDDEDSDSDKAKGKAVSASVKVVESTSTSRDNSGQSEIVLASEAASVAHKSISNTSKKETVLKKVADKANARTVTEDKRATRQPGSKVAYKSNNEFDVFDPDNDSINQESTSEEPKSDQSSVNIKQLNVTFEEPEPKTNSPKKSDQSISPVKSPQSNKSAFDPSKYGRNRYMAKSSRGSSHRGGAKPPSHVFASAQQWKRDDNSHSSPRRCEAENARATFHPAGQDQPHRRVKNLIDVDSEEPSDKEIAPPPGFDYRSNEVLQPSGPEMSTPQALGYPVPMRSDLPQTLGNINASTISGSPRLRPPHLDFNVQSTVPKRDISYLNKQTLANLTAAMGGSSKLSQDGQSNENKSRTNKKQQDDEYSTRKYHKTMGQKMAKPGKSKNTAKKQETKAEKDARIAKAKADAYGDATDAKTTLAKQQPKAERPVALADMTARKRQLLKKNQAIASLHQDALTEGTTQHVAGKLLEELKPVLLATRAFKGIVKVEIQLGQALILKNNQLSEEKLYSAKEWATLLNGKELNKPEVIFTNILTTNGRDIDRILEFKDTEKPTYLWEKSCAETISITYEFSCQDKSDNAFMLLLDQEGNHSLNRATSTTIGQVNLHAPEQIWDARAVVSGTMKLLRPSAEIVAGAEQFKEEVYIPGGKVATVYFRLPTNHAFTITSVIIKRTSTHNCLLPGREGIQLRVTEVKALSHSVHPTDKKLYRSYEPNYAVLVNEGRIHYEISITDKNVEKVFDKNPAIEVGEFAPIEDPERIMSFSQAHALIDMTTIMLKRIDWAGANNIGTLQRIAGIEHGRRAVVANTLPLNANRNVAIPMGTTAPPTLVPPTGTQSQYSRVGTGAGAGVNNTVPEPIIRQLHGVRTNTPAELFRDAVTGDLFYLGQGGARIPVISEQLEGLTPDVLGPVLPDDSASQIGNVKMKIVGSGKAKAGVWDDKPAGFW